MLGVLSASPCARLTNVSLPASYAGRSISTLSRLVARSMPPGSCGLSSLLFHKRRQQQPKQNENDAPERDMIHPMASEPSGIGTYRCTTLRNDMILFFLFQAATAPLLCRV